MVRINFWACMIALLVWVLPLVAQQPASFKQIVTLSTGYHVFVTPKRDCKGLFVANENANGFEVRELSGGQSSAEFDYRIVAHRKGYEKMRLPVAAMPRSSTKVARP